MASSKKTTSTKKSTSKTSSKKKTTTKKVKLKSKLTKPSVSLARNGYKMTLSFSNVDSDADYFYIERWIYEAQDTKKSSNKAKEYKKVKLGAKKNSSWSFTLDKTKYYPFVADGTDKNPKQSDYAQRIKKIVFKVWNTGTVSSGKVKKNISSDSVTKTYEFDPSVDPKVAITYDEDGTSFTFAVDINDDNSITSTSKKVATRAWAWLTAKTKGDKKAHKVSDYKGQWYNRDVGKQIRKKVKTTISPSKPVMFKVHAYSAGPGGKSKTKTATHVFAVPKPVGTPKISRPNVLKNAKVDNGYGIYNVSWSVDTGYSKSEKISWYPVDNITIQYRDQEQYKGASDIYGENMGAWSNAKENISSSIKKIQTNELGAVANDNVRYFRVLTEHDGNVTPGYVTGVVAYGRPTNVSGVTAESTTVSGKQGILFKWTAPPTKLYGTSPDTLLYNGAKLGKGGRARILIFKNSIVAKNLIKTIYYGDGEWTSSQYFYPLPDDDIGKELDFCFQVRVGLNNLNPGGLSDNLWVNDVVVPSKCKNVSGTKMSNNTTVELTWDNPTKDDAIRNGVEVAWSNMINAWESNNLPSTARFENGTMTKAYITGLTAGDVYYFWVRLYDEKDGTTTYGEWSDPSEGVYMSDNPATPSLTLSRSWIKAGGNLSAQWVYSAGENLPQTSAQIEICSDTTITETSKWTPIANVTGEEDNCTIDLSARVNGSSDDPMNPVYKYPVGEYFLRVIVTNSMGSSTSEPIELKIAGLPSCTLTSSSIVDYIYESVSDATGELTDIKVQALRELPFNVNVTGDGDLNLYVYSIDDFEWQHPDGEDNIYQGDCVWTSVVEEGAYTLSNVSLADNARYRLQLECVDPDTLLTSEPQYIDFEVHWKHQAVMPDQSTVTIEIDDNGDATATLLAVKPEGAGDTDVCDVYRTTADGRYLCYRDLPFGRAVKDVLPTFGETAEPAYCFCTRTPEGDEAWVDMEYELVDYGIIINYGDKSVSLPWNVTIDDSRTKQGEIRSHLGGTKLYYGQPFIERSQSLSTEVVKMEDEELVEQLYELSRFTELCYVRCSNNIGYPATVDVSISREYNKNIVSVSLSAKEADANGEFMGELLSIDDTPEPTPTPSKDVTSQIFSSEEDAQNYVFANSYYIGDDRKPWRAFDGNDSSFWSTEIADSTAGKYIGYNFLEPVSNAKIQMTTSVDNVSPTPQFKFQGCADSVINDDSVWDDLTDVITLSQDESKQTLEYTINSDKAYCAYRLYIVRGGQGDTFGWAVYELSINGKTNVTEAQQ